MSGRGIVDDALERLGGANLSTAVQGVRSVERGGVETVLVSVRPDTPDPTRNALAQVLDGLRCEWIDVEPSVRGIVHERLGRKDGQTWRMGTPAEIEWIQANTRVGRTIASAVPPIFDAYATVVIPEDAAVRRASESTLLRLLAEQSPDQPWWLGYLDTGAHDVVFDHAAKVVLYTGWPYVLVEAGPQQAGTWREDDPWRGRLPDLIYPADQSWLVSMLWDDDWRCLGGPDALLSAVLAEPGLDSHSVGVDEDATPPGYIAR